MDEKKKGLIYRGIIKIGDIEINCAVNESGTRLISQYSVNKAFDRGAGGSKNLPRIIELKALEPFIDKDLMARATNLIQLEDMKCFEAELIPDICEVWLKARDAGVLKGKQLETATKADIIMRALSRIGIIALIDEATGYQYNRKKDALRLLLEQYIAEGLQKWLKRFPDKFFEELDRLYQNEKTTSRARPQYYGLFINSYVYEPIEEGYVKMELDKKNILDDKKRKTQFHRWLTEFGVNQLTLQIGRVMGIMEDSKNLEECKFRLARQKGLTIIEENLFGSEEKIIKKPKQVIQYNPTSAPMIERIKADNLEEAKEDNYEKDIESLKKFVPKK